MINFIKRIAVSIILIAILYFIFISIDNKKEYLLNDNETINTSLCFEYPDKTKDNSWLSLNFLEEKIEGEFRNLPKNTDSKIGKFYGDTNAVTSEDDKISVLVWWDTLSEGMNEKEQLYFEIENNNLNIMFGEMIKQEDNSYVYKDIENSISKTLVKTDCENLNEKIFVEKYIRDNIKDIATNEEVLGGTWYVTHLEIDTLNKEIEVEYEDGHILSIAKIKYEYKKESSSIEIKNFEIIEE